MLSGTKETFYNFPLHWANTLLSILPSIPWIMIFFFLLLLLEKQTVFRLVWAKRFVPLILSYGSYLSLRSLVQTYWSVYNWILKGAPLQISGIFSFLVLFSKNSCYLVLPKFLAFSQFREITRFCLCSLSYHYQL